MVDVVPVLTLQPKQYDVVLCDPPWAFDDRLAKMKKPVHRSASSHYNTLTVPDIMKLDIQSLAKPSGCLLALWVPSTFLQQGLAVVNAWGFAFKTTFIWVKMKKDYAKEADINKGTRVGMGRSFRGAHELCLIATSGDSVYKKMTSHSERSVMLEPNLGHSRKPDELHRRLDNMFAGPDIDKCELFARRSYPGWDCFGDELDGRDIRDVIVKNCCQQLGVPVA